MYNSLFWSISPQDAVTQGGFLVDVSRRRYPMYNRVRRAAILLVASREHTAHLYALCPRDTKAKMTGAFTRDYALVASRECTFYLSLNQKRDNHERAFCRVAAKSVTPAKSVCTALKVSAAKRGCQSKHLHRLIPASHRRRPARSMSTKGEWLSSPS